MNFGTRVEVVPDDNAEANPLIPKDVLAALGQNTVLAGLNMMYVRASTWDRIKDGFAISQNLMPR
jgi:hypothetical protein